MTEVIDLEAWDWEDLARSIPGQLRHLGSFSQAEQDQVAEALCSLHQERSETEHWLHDHPPEATALLRLFAYSDTLRHIEPLEELLFSTVPTCAQCVVAYHTAQVHMKEEPDGQSRTALAELQSKDEKRVALALQQAARDAATEIEAGSITALFEVLSYEGLLEDAEVMAAAEAALLAMSKHHDLALDEGGRYPGVYMLLAHSSMEIRSLVGPIVRSLGPFQDESDVLGIFSVLDRWQDILQAPESFEEQYSEKGRLRWKESRQHLWQALSTIFSLLQRDAMLSVCSSMPSLVDTITKFACEGSPVSWPGLGCLKSIFQSAKGKAWEFMKIFAEQLIDRLEGIAKQTLDARLQAGVVGVFKAIALSLTLDAKDPNSGLLRRQILSSLLQSIPTVPLVRPQTAQIARHAGFDIVSAQISSGSVAEDAHIFGPVLCRLLKSQGTEEGSKLEKTAEKLSKQLLDLDAVLLAAVNDDQMLPSEEHAGSKASLAAANQSSLLVSPALWKGLAGSPNVQVSINLLSAAASLAHVSAAQQSGNSRRDVGFYTTPWAGGMSTVEASQDWPVMQNARLLHVNPHAIRAKEAPGLLLQAMRQAAIDHLAQREPKRSSFQKAPCPQKVALVMSLVHLMVGLHNPLRTAAEACLLDLTDRRAVKDALEALSWTPACAEGLFRALTGSMELICGLTAPQALVRADTRAVLGVISEALNAIGECGSSITTARDKLVDQTWKFLLSVLKHGLPVAHFNMAEGALQKAFNLVPVIWEERSHEAGKMLSSKSRDELKKQLSFVADLFRWGSAWGQAVAKAWRHATHKVLAGLPEAAEKILPPEALQAALDAMKPDSQMPDEARMLLAPLLKGGAPGNLGQAGIAPFPSRSKVALPQVALTRRPILQSAHMSKSGLAAMRTSSQTMSSKQKISVKTAAENPAALSFRSPGAELPSAEDSSKAEDLIDLTLEDSDAPLGAASQVKAEELNQTSRPTESKAEENFPQEVLDVLRPASEASLRTRQDYPEPSPDPVTDDGSYDSDVPLRDVVDTQQALLKSSSTLKRDSSERWSLANRVTSMKPGNRRNFQKPITSFLSPSPPAKATPVQPAERSIEGVKLENIWAQAMKAQAERAAKGSDPKPKSKPKGKSGPHSRLRAAIEKAVDECKEANKRLPRSEREPTSLPRGRRRRRSRSGTPEDVFQPPHKPPYVSRGSLEEARAKPSSFGIPGQPAGGELRAANIHGKEAAGAHLHSTALKEDTTLEEQLQAVQTKPLVALPEKRLRLGLPAAPKAVRKAIQLAAAPGVTSAAVKRRNFNAGTSSGPQQMVLSMEEVQRDVLGWDFVGIISGRATSAGLSKLGRVPATFDSLETYSRVFWALLLEELWAHIQQAHEEGFPDIRTKSSSKHSGPSSVVLQARSVQKRSMLHRVDFSVSGRQKDDCRGEDLILLTKTAPEFEGGKLTLPPAVHLLGIVEKVETDEKLPGSKNVVVYVNLTAMGRGSSRQDGAARSILHGEFWHATRLLSWTPHHRQFQALCRVHLLPTPLLQQLLHPDPPPQSCVATPLDRCGIASPLVTAVEAAFNDSQRAAIAACCSDASLFTLIQGPPGTGKTATVIAIISALLAAKSSPAQSLPPVMQLRPSRHTQNAAQGRPHCRILVCAQSNAAIDELIMRLADPGVFDAQGQRRVPSMVRLGKMDAAHPSVKSFHIDAVAERFGTAGNEQVPWSGHINAMSVAEDGADKSRQEIAELRRQLQAARNALDAAESQTATSASETGDESGKGPGNLAALRDNRRRLALKLKAARDEAQRGSELLSRARREVREAVVQQAEVVACTLSSAGGDLLSLSKSNSGFQALIVDEAAQALEPASHIALQLLSPGAKIVLVGDPKQLPATVLSKAAEAGNLTQSLFERLQQASWPVVMLSEQYRMHPRISRWPSSYFYDGKLVDGESVRSGACSADFHSRPCFPPLAVFDCRDGIEKGGKSSGGGSLSNSSEAELVCALLTGFVESYPAALKGTIAVLTPYRAQLFLLKSLVTSSLHKDSLQYIELSTVDGFQGKEADVVIFSCVRARAVGLASSVGFLADVRRMNVALTRARRGLWVVGHTETLQCSPPWAAFLAHARQQHCIFQAVKPYAKIVACGRQSLVRGTSPPRRPQTQRPAVASKAPVKRAGAEPTAAPNPKPGYGQEGQKKSAVNFSRETVGVRGGGSPSAMLIEADRRAKKLRPMPPSVVPTKRKSIPTDSRLTKRAKGLPAAASQAAAKASGRSVQQSDTEAASIGARGLAGRDPKVQATSDRTARLAKHTPSRNGSHADITSASRGASPHEMLGSMRPPRSSSATVDMTAASPTPPPPPPTEPPDSKGQNPLERYNSCEISLKDAPPLPDTDPPDDFEYTLSQPPPLPLSEPPKAELARDSLASSATALNTPAALPRGGDSARKTAVLSVDYLEEGEIV